MKKRGGALPPIDSVAGERVLAVGSYRYSIAALTDGIIYSYGADGRATHANATLRPTVTNGFFPLEHIIYNKTSDMSYPDKKVLFYLWEASHDKNADFWLEPGATSTVALGDGSAKTMKVYAELSNFRNLPEHAGPAYQLGSGGELWLAHFYATFGGIRGRDIE